MGCVEQRHLFWKALGRVCALSKPHGTGQVWLVQVMGPQLLSYPRSKGTISASCPATLGRLGHSWEGPEQHQEAERCLVRL